MRILHTYCLNYNIGDYALGIGLKNLLRECLDVDLIAETNIQGRLFDEYYINEVVNKRYDLLLIGGGGLIHGSHWPNGWFWLIDKDLIKTIKIPFVVYGVGDNYFDGELLPDRAIEHLRETYKYASYFSVRNDGSYDRLIDRLGFELNEIPDPGFHVGLNTEYKRPVLEPYVIIELADDKSKQRFDSGNKSRFIRDLRKVVVNLAKYHKVIFIPHVIEDIDISDKVANGIDNVEVLRFGDFAFDRSRDVLSYYKYAEFVLAMRGHGQIVPIGFNVPVISLQNHPKHIGLMKRLGLEEYNVNINEPDFLVKLENTISKLTEDREKIIEKYKKLNIDLINQSRLAMNSIRNIATL